jgi:hypothetical protein
VIIAPRIGTAHPCTRAKAGRHWSPDTARSGRRQAARRRKSCGRRRRRLIAAQTVLHGRRCRRSGGRRSRWSRACRGCSRCCSTAAGGGDGFLATGREFRLVLFQALQGRRTTGRHARADLRIIGAARAADGGNLCAARLSGCGGRCCLWLGSFGRCSRCSRGSSGFRRCGFGRLGSRGRRCFHGAHRALAAR